MMGTRQTETRGYDETNVVTAWRHRYCYLRHPGVKSDIKRRMRKAARRRGKIKTNQLAGLKEIDMSPLLDIAERARNGIPPDFSDEVFLLAENVVNEKVCGVRETTKEWANRLAETTSKFKD